MCLTSLNVKINFIDDVDIAGVLSAIGENPKTISIIVQEMWPEGVLAAAAFHVLVDKFKVIILDEGEKFRARKLGIKDFKKYNIEDMIKGDVIFVLQVSGDLVR